MASIRSTNVEAGLGGIFLGYRRRPRSMQTCNGMVATQSVMCRMVLHPVRHAAATTQQMYSNGAAI